MTRVGAQPTAGLLATEEAPPSGGALRSYLELLRRRWRLVTAMSVGTIVAVATAALLWDAPYAARSVLQVPTTWTGSLENVQLDVIYTERLLNTYVALSESGRLHERVTARLESDDTASLTTELDIPANTELLVARTTASTPELAADGANAMTRMLAQEIREALDVRFRTAAGSLREQLTELDERIAALDQGEDLDQGDVDNMSPTLGARGELLVQREALQRTYFQVLALGEAATAGVTIVETAEPPAERTDTRLLLALATVVGILGAFVLVAVVDRIDERVFDVGRAVTRRGHEVLGEMSARAVESARDPPDALQAVPIDPQAVRLAYRLRAASPRTLLTTSIHTDTTTPVHVAVLCRALASTGLRVVVVDTALGPAPVASLLGVEAREGTSEWLRALDALPERVMRSDYDNLYVVADRWPTEFIGLPNWPGKALEQLAGGFDISVAFVPALLDRAEASLFGEAVEGTVLIAREGAVRYDELTRAFEQIEAFPSRFLGVVVATRRWARRRHRD